MLDLILITNVYAAASDKSSFLQRIEKEEIQQKNNELDEAKQVLLKSLQDAQTYMTQSVESRMLELTSENAETTVIFNPIPTIIHCPEKVRRSLLEDLNRSILPKFNQLGILLKTIIEKYK